MRRINTVNAALLVTVLLFALLMALSDYPMQEGRAEHAGESIDNAAEPVGEHVENAGEAIQDAVKGDRRERAS